MKKPKFVKEKHLKYLDDLRESGQTNMYGAGTYLMTAFPELTKKEARGILTYWMKTFGERHKKEE